jgi:hypothetical protein
VAEATQKLETLREQVDAINDALRAEVPDIAFPAIVIPEATIGAEPDAQSVDRLDLGLGDADPGANRPQGLRVMTDGQAGASGRPPLLPHHRCALEEGSAISAEIISERAYYSIETKRELKAAGGSPGYADHLPALGIPIYGPHGERVALSRRRGARRLLACLQSASADASPSRWSGCF